MCEVFFNVLTVLNRAFLASQFKFLSLGPNCVYACYSAVPLFHQRGRANAWIRLWFNWNNLTKFIADEILRTAFSLFGFFSDSTWKLTFDLVTAVHSSCRCSSHLRTSEVIYPQKADNVSKFKDTLWIFPMKRPCVTIRQMCWIRASASIRLRCQGSPQ